MLRRATYRLTNALSSPFLRAFRELISFLHYCFSCLCVASLSTYNSSSIALRVVARIFLVDLRSSRLIRMLRRIEGTTQRYYPRLTFKQLQLGYRARSLRPFRTKKEKKIKKHVIGILVVLHRISNQ